MDPVQTMTLPLPPERPAPSFPVIRRGDPVPPALKGGVVAIGNFDGVHRGHRHVIAEARRLAAGRPVLVFTFEPHPRSFFQPDKPLFHLCDFAGKVRLLAAAGVDAVAVAAFDHAFAALGCEAFADETLGAWLGASHVVIGRDFHYGAGRSGDAETLRAAGARLGFGVTEAQPKAVDGVTVSSSAIREALSLGDLATANRLLGHAWFVTAEVIHGEKMGRQLGYPTANLRLPPQTALRHGIYAVKIGFDGLWRDGVASFGRRPTFDNGAPLLEVHVFDFKGDLYGRTVDVAFAGFIRDEEKFDSLEALIRQMDDDSLKARAILAA